MSALIMEEKSLNLNQKLRETWETLGAFTDPFADSVSKVLKEQAASPDLLSKLQKDIDLFENNVELKPTESKQKGEKGKPFNEWPSFSND
ncbi:MAG: hypothetical protein U0V74_02720 [Chitinophagales bacterium]